MYHTLSTKLSKRRGINLSSDASALNNRPQPFGRLSVYPTAPSLSTPFGDILIIGRDNKGAKLTTDVQPITTL
jgi:hypothetical protein